MAPKSSGTRPPRCNVRRVSLLAYLGAELGQAIFDHMLRCQAHGYQPAVLACPCALAGTPAARATMDGVFCGGHVARFLDDDRQADDDLEPTCFRCLVNRGLLVG